MAGCLLVDPKGLVVVEEEEVAHAVETDAQLVGLGAFEVGAQLEGAHEAQVCELME
jgi:hypothetical protein